MALKLSLLAALAVSFAVPALAGDMNITIKDPYARSSAKSGAAFFTIMNHSDVDDRLLSAMSEVSKRVELHTHQEDANGVMRMMELEDGITVPAGGTHALARGGDHVMFLGLVEPLSQGETVSVTLIFERAGEVVIDIPVDNNRKAKSGHTHSHTHGHSGAATD